MVYCGRRGIIILIEQFPMTTYRDLNSTGDTTRWLYDEGFICWMIFGCERRAFILRVKVV